MRPFLRHILLSATVVWIWGHALLLIGLSMRNPEAPALGQLHPNPASALVTLAAVVGVVLIAVRRRNEDLFLANLGLGVPAIGALAAVPAAVLEAALWWVTA